MSLFARRLRPGESDRHDAVERRIAALGAHVQPDPLFRRRLRSSTINRYVAVREQVGKRATGRPRRRHMGRVGRSVLLVTVTLAASAATVLGASRDALPGDALYNVKLRVEGLRFEVVPAHLHAVLAADVVGQRIEEIARLVDAGRSADVLALQPAFEEALAHLERASVASGPAVRARAGEQVVVLDAYIVHLSAEARAIVRGAWVDATSRESTRPLDADVPTSNRGAGGVEGPGRVATPGWAGPGAAAQPTSQRPEERLSRASR